MKHSIYTTAVAAALATVISIGGGSGVQAEEFYTFDGPDFPACYNVTTVHNATSVDDIVSIVQAAAAAANNNNNNNNGTTNNTTTTNIRASGKAHMWYDTMCADVPTTIVRTEFVNNITDFDLPAGSANGTVVVEAGVTFFQLADYLHARGANIGTGLVNWNISLGGSVAMGAHRTSLGSDAVVVGGVLALDIVDGSGRVRTVVKDEADDTWLAASTSLGLLGIIVRLKMQIYPETVLWANQTTLDEDEVLNGDIYGMIEPYITANFWWWPFKRKFHYRTYGEVAAGTTNQLGVQSTFSITHAQADTALALLNSGKVLETSNELAEDIFFDIWSQPNFHTGDADDVALTEWPVTGYHYDVLIGGLWPGQQTEWDDGLHGYTMELAFPVTRANDMLRRVRELFDAQYTEHLINMTSTYRSGINIKFGRPNYDLLGQVTYNTSDGVDWSKGAIMLDFPTFWPTIGDHLRFNEPFYANLSTTLINEFPCRPHWTKNTRDVFSQALKNLDQDHIARFKAVREDFDPNGIYRSVVGEIIGLYD